MPEESGVGLTPERGEFLDCKRSGGGAVGIYDAQHQSQVFLGEYRQRLPFDIHTPFEWGLCPGEGA